MSDFKVITIDTETWLIGAGRLAPPLVCLSQYADFDTAALMSAVDGVKYAEKLLRNKTIRVVGQNIAFDFGVLVQAGLDINLVWQAYDDGRIADTMIHGKMIAIADGTSRIDPTTGRKPRFSLAALVNKYLGEVVEGKTGDAWRYRYRELSNVPVEDYPQEARDYAIEDARWTYRLWKSQCDYVESTRGYREMPDMLRQCGYAFALHLMSAWGLKTDPVAVAVLEKELTVTVTKAMQQLTAVGVYRPNGTKDTKKVKALVEMDCAKRGAAVALTDSGATSTAKAVLQESEDPILQTLAAISADQKLLSTYIPLLKSGTERPLNSRYSLVDSGRTSSSHPNVQNQPRKGGVRECFIPREGWIYVCADYHVAELCGLAQILLDKYGKSNMADALQQGRELHLETAAGVLGLTYEETVKRFKAGDKKAKEARQLAKAMNFGLPAGLGAKAFCAFAKASYGLEIEEDAAKNLKESWLSRYPEMHSYFEDIGYAAALEGDNLTVEHHRSKRVRGGCTFTSAANTYFQGCVADGSKLAVMETVKRCYSRPDSDLYGSRLVAFIHDELILESPDLESARKAAKELSAVMIESMQVFIPDIPITADAHLMLRWYKDAEPVFSDDGELIPWKPHL